MSPFSPVHFIKENKTRCILLMFMLFLGYGVYLGGLYVSNPYDNWKLGLSYCDKHTLIQPASSDEEGVSEFEAFVEAVEATGKVKLLWHGESSGFGWETIMGFESGRLSFTFRSVEDFKEYCEYLDIECDFTKLKSGSMIMSERFAKNRDLKLGDKVDKNYDRNMYDEYTLDAMTSEAGYTLYFINEEPVDIYAAIVIGNDISGKELYELVYDTQKEHDVWVQDSIRDNIKKEYETFDLIYTFVVMLLSIILAVTINAAFVGMYQRRNFEFAVYRAIGISKKRIVGKIVGELLLMDVIALAIGGAVFFLGLYLFNNMVLYPQGKYLCYYNITALLGLVLCNVTVLVPLMITRCRQMLKADICEY